MLTIGVAAAVPGFFLFLLGPEPLGLFGMFFGAAFIIRWIWIAVRAVDGRSGARSIGVGLVLGLIGLFFLGSVGFRLETNGGTIGLVTASCGGLFFVGGLAILVLAKA